MNIWLIGTGPMAVEYYKVLRDLNEHITVIGRGVDSAKKFEEETGKIPLTGGLSTFLDGNSQIPDRAIVAVGVEQILNCTYELVKFGLKDILVEKPGGLNYDEVSELSNLAKSKSLNIFIGYNRRCFASVIKAKEIIEADGGLTSFNFEFTEWSHKIRDLQKADGVKDQWLLANSSHVIDLAFYIGGLPKNISCYKAGRGEIDWHPDAARYTGAGITEDNVLFNYQANWNAPGRWRVEFLTRKHRLYLAPLEKLQIQEIGSIAVSDVNGIDYSIDERYKPGLYLQVNAFLTKNDSYKNSIGECLKSLSAVKKIEYC